MKSYNVDRYILDRNNIEDAIVNVCKNKKKKQGRETRTYRFARKILADVPKYTERVYEMIESYDRVIHARLKGMEPDENDLRRMFRPSKPKVFELKCDNGKIRDISCVSIFPDQIIHRLIIDASKDVFMSGMYKYSCGSIPKRGNEYGMKYLRKKISIACHTNPSEIKYVAKLDIKKCFPHVSHSALKAELAKKFRGSLFLNLCYDIIDSYNVAEQGEPPRGLPIGYYTSPWFNNFLLSKTDRQIKEEMSVKIYMRNMDDMVFMWRNKKQLHDYVRRVGESIIPFGFELKSNWQVYRFSYFNKKKGKTCGRDIDVLGYRLFRDRTILRKQRAFDICRYAMKIKKKYKRHERVTIHNAQSMLSRLGKLRHCNSKAFYLKFVKPYVNIKKLKGKVSRYDKFKSEGKNRINGDAHLPV